MTPPRRRRFPRAALAALLLCAFAAPAFAKEHKVNIDDQKFSPKEIKIKKGDTIVWTNNDDRDHTVTADDGKSFDSGNLNSGKKYQHKFDKAGRYKYHCDYHPRMKAVVVVED
jgi:plastocyanin